MSDTPYDAAIENRTTKPELVVDDELTTAIAKYLWTVSKDPAPEEQDIEQWLQRRDTVEWNGAYARSAASELRRWLSWMGDRSLGLDSLNRSGERHLIAYAERLRGRVSSGGIAGTTAQTYFGYLRACLEWMVRRDLLDTNPAAKASVEEALPTDTRSRSEQQFWTPKQRDRLLSYTTDAVDSALNDDSSRGELRAALRDRALIGLLYYSAVRVGEIARRSDDQRDGRAGLRWESVDLDRGRIQILGKGEQEHVWHPIPGPTVDYLTRHKRVQQPASDSWPVFASHHGPSLWAAARQAELPGHSQVETLVNDCGSIHAVLREYEIIPPALTAAGVRTRLKTLTQAAGIDTGDDHEYLLPHGARRGAIGEVFKRDRGEAQDLGRHADLKTTEAAYRHLDVEEQRDRLDSLFDAID